MIKPKAWLEMEQSRNKRNAKLYTEMVQKAYGSGCDVLVGHHIGFELNHDISTEEEIPAADSLIFDHAIMHACFGKQAIPIMMSLAAQPSDARDSWLQFFWNNRHHVHAREEKLQRAFRSPEPHTVDSY